jgi:bisanhydrobacterioruberin hydratase
MNSKTHLLVFFLVLTHIFGAIGIGVPLHQDFVYLTPFHLLLSFGVVAFAHVGLKQDFFKFIGIAALIGFVSECIGVQTGLLFGNYSYGDVLGPKVLGTPIFIGLNWALVAYSAGVFAQFISPKGNFWWRVTVQAILMVFLDFWMEPVAMSTGMWSWEGDAVPLHNYMGWFTISLIVSYLFHRSFTRIENLVARYYYLILLAFFIGLNFVTY